MKNELMPATSEKGQVKLSIKEVKQLKENYFLNCIDSEGYTNEAIKEPAQKIKFLFDTFKKEYCHQNNERTPINVKFTDWAQGLPSCFNIEFGNYQIENLLRSWGYVKDGETKNKIDRRIDQYWNSLYWEMLKLANKYKVEIK